MNDRFQRGFTIIELVLFLGITGALFAGLMIGVNTSINTQHYRESAVGYEALLERQYARVEYPQNNRTGQWSCAADTGVVPSDDSGVARATSGCVILGRYVEVKDEGAVIETGDVIGFEPSDIFDSDTPTPVGDIPILDAYQPRRSPIEVERHDVDWGTRLVGDGGAASATSFLILRSPQSGLIRTFALDSPLPAQLVNAIDDTYARATVKSCLVPAGFVSVPVHSVSIDARIGSANGVILNESDDAC